MDEKTKTALLGSIEKWQKIVDGTGTDAMSRNCPLCQLFIENDCKGCPVSDRTGEENCEGSPYEEWGDATFYDVAIRGRRAIDPQTPEALEAAKAELAFLQSLLPSDTP